MASFKASARSLDQGVGAVLQALDEQDLADNTLVVFTTDHGLPFPGAKATLTDRGLGVLCILRGPGGFLGGHVTDAWSARSTSTRRCSSWPARRSRTGSTARRCCRWPRTGAPISATNCSPS